MSNPKQELRVELDIIKDGIKPMLDEFVDIYAAASIARGEDPLKIEHIRAILWLAVSEISDVEFKARELLFADEKVMH